MDTKALRQKILDLAIRGKLVPQDLSDEPASVLLERIREQKKQMVKEGKLKAKDIKNDTIIFVGEDNLHYEKFADGTAKCIEDEIPFELPEGWEWTRLQSITSILTDGTHKTPQYSDAGYIFLSSKNVTSGKIDWDNIMYIPEALHRELYNRLAPRVGDILLAKNGTTGIAAIVDREEVFDIYVSLALIRIVDNIINPLYILRAIEGSYIQDYFNSSLKGIGVPNLHLEHIRKALIPIPPCIEQDRIILRADMLLPLVEQIASDETELHHLVSKAKSKILDLAIRGQLVPQNPNDEPASVLLERIRAEKEELIKQGKIKHDKKESVIFKGDDNSYYEKIGSEVRCIDEEIPFDIPDTWIWMRLSSICSLNSGKSIKVRQLTEDGIYPVYGGNGINGTYSDYNVEPETIIIGRVGFYCGSIYKTSSKSWITDNALITTIKNPNIYNLDFLANLLIYLNLGKTSVSTAQPVVSGKGILPLLVPVPPMKEQLRIISQINKFSSLIDCIEESLS